MILIMGAQTPASVFVWLLQEPVLPRLAISTASDQPSLAAKMKMVCRGDVRRAEAPENFRCEIFSL